MTVDSPDQRAPSLARRLAARLRPYAAPRTAVQLLPPILALALLAYRFANFDLVAFVNDEPKFLEGARQQLVTGSWRSVSTLVGNQGMAYGPTPFWFYGVIHWLFGPAPDVHIRAMCVALTCAHLTMAIAVSRVSRIGLAGFAAVLAVLASSPFQFFWSRLAWDQTVDVAAAFVVAFFCTRGPFGWKGALALGAGLGLAASSHLMVTALVAVSFGVLLLGMKRSVRDFVGGTLAAVGGFLVVNVPYLLYLAGHPPAPSPGREVTISLIGNYLVQPMRVATLAGIRYHFDQVWGDFVGWAGPLGIVWSGMEAGAMATAITLTLAVLTGAGLVALCVSRTPHLRRLGLLGASTWVGYAFYYASRTLNPHPHYQFPTYWIVAVGLAGLIAVLRTRLASAAAVLIAALWVLAAVQFVFIWQWMGYIREKGGTPAIHYNATLGTDRQAVASLCEAREPTLLVDNRTVVYPQALLYVAMADPRCSGKRITFCPWEGCPPASAGERIFRLTYADPKAAKLVVQ